MPRNEREQSLPRKGIFGRDYVCIVPVFNEVWAVEVYLRTPFSGGSYWIPGSYASMLFKNLTPFSRSLKNQGFKEEMMAKIGLYDIVKPTTPESNKSEESE